eukprot:Lithocolla_globosa_v1_NODE_5187_length_1286_cov_171.666937.p1 type:complete len:182 gc:universal NODE_5187_length_1286_cov_171.666937:659-1204(+)
MYRGKGKMVQALNIYCGFKLLQPLELRRMNLEDIHVEIDQFCANPHPLFNDSKHYKGNLQSDLLRELPTLLKYTTDYMNVNAGDPSFLAPDCPQGLLLFWRDIKFEIESPAPGLCSLEVPTFMFLAELSLLCQPSSGAAERVFSMLSWMFTYQQQGSLDDKKETSLMSRYNSLERDKSRTR